jgi:hypothetical protein
MNTQSSAIMLAEGLTVIHGYIHMFALLVSRSKSSVQQESRRKTHNSFSFVIPQENTEWSKSLCASDDYSIKKSKNILILAADRQGQGDSRLTLTPSFTPNSKYVIMVSDWNRLKYIWVFLY